MMPSVESIKRMTIFVAKMSQDGKEGQMRNFLLYYLRYRNSNEIKIYLDCNHTRCVRNDIYCVGIVVEAFIIGIFRFFGN